MGTDGKLVRLVGRVFEQGGHAALGAEATDDRDGSGTEPRTPGSQDVHRRHVHHPGRAAAISRADEPGPLMVVRLKPDTTGVAYGNSVEATRSAMVTQGPGYTPMPTTPIAHTAIAAPSRPGMGTGSRRTGA